MYVILNDRGHLTGCGLHGHKPAIFSLNGQSNIVLFQVVSYLFVCLFVGFYVIEWRRTTTSLS